MGKLKLGRTSFTRKKMPFHRYANETHEVREIFEELVGTVFDELDSKAQILYEKNGSAYAATEEQQFHVEIGSGRIEARVGETGERLDDLEDFSTYVFRKEVSEVPERPLGSTESGIKRYLRDFARELYPERKPPNQPDWDIHPPGEREDD